MSTWGAGKMRIAFAVALLFVVAVLLPLVPTLHERWRWTDAEVARVETRWAELEEWVRAAIPPGEGDGELLDLLSRLEGAPDVEDEIAAGDALPEEWERCLEDLLAWAERGPTDAYEGDPDGTWAGWFLHLARWAFEARGPDPDVARAMARLARVLELRGTQLEALVAVELRQSVRNQLGPEDAAAALAPFALSNAEVCAVAAHHALQVDALWTRFAADPEHARDMGYDPPGLGAGRFRRARLAFHERAAELLLPHRTDPDPAALLAMLRATQREEDSPFALWMEVAPSWLEERETENLLEE